MKLSVVIPAFNAAHAIAPTLDAVLAATQVNFEVVVVDDGSTDHLREVLAPYLDAGKVRLLRQANSGGPASPRNRGIAETSGDYILFLDADDVIVEEELEPALSVLAENPQVGMLCSNFDVTDSNLNTRLGRNIDRYATFQAVLQERVDSDTWLVHPEDAVASLLQTNFVGTSSVIARRSVLEEVGLFDESLRNLDDRDMWLRLANRAPILYREKVFYRYRDSAGSISKQRELDQYLERARVAEKVRAASGSPRIRELALGWRSASLLKAGYILFHEKQKPGEALPVFWASFRARPGKASFNGIVKCLLPERVYRLLKRFKSSE